MWKRLALVSVIVAATTAVVQATVKPTLGDMVARSTVILVATVVEVDKGDDAEVRKVTIEPSRILKGSIGPLPKRMTFTYTRLGKGNVRFSELRDAKQPHVMFFNLTTDKDGHLQLTLTDPWFGVEGADVAGKVTELQTAVQKLLEK
ncbi:MAG: hypothetical protein U0792_10645 [Gemmataceae bacterium]